MRTETERRVSRESGVLYIRYHTCARGLADDDQIAHGSRVAGIVQVVLVHGGENGHAEQAEISAARREPRNGGPHGLGIGMDGDETHAHAGDVLDRLHDRVVDVEQLHMRDLLHSTLRINRTLTVAVETTAMSCPAAGKLSRSNEP